MPIALEPGDYVSHDVFHVGMVIATTDCGCAEIEFANPWFLQIVHPAELARLHIGRWIRLMEWLGVVGLPHAIQREKFVKYLDGLTDRQCSGLADWLTDSQEVA